MAASSSDTKEKLSKSEKPPGVAKRKAPAVNVTRSCQSCFGIMMFTSNMVKNGESPECFGLKGKRVIINNEDVRLRETLDREMKRQAKLREHPPAGTRTPGSESLHMVLGYSQAYCRKEGDKAMYVGPYCIYGVNIHMVTKTRSYSNSNSRIGDSGGVMAGRGQMGQAGANTRPADSGAVRPPLPGGLVPHHQQRQAPSAQPHSQQLSPTTPTAPPPTSSTNPDDIMEQINALVKENEVSLKGMYEKAGKLGESVTRFWTGALTDFGPKFQKSSTGIFKQTTSLPGRMSGFIEKWREHAGKEEDD